MSYVALYRKWRPDVFSEVKGQEHVVTTLQNQLVHDRIGHAYLFHGTRGTGKTTLAKLFAKAVNCEHRLPDGSPCNTCEMCRSISEGSSMNVIEIDAASNNGVDNIREIRDEVQYSPATGKYKVYIIDEAHMLSPAACNALLKTLEEPPSYVIFILATTDTHAIPITILSRCQKYDFHRISVETIAARLDDLLNREGIPYEEEAVHYVAKVADGSMRDALSVMDQCISYLLGETLTYDKVLEILGAVDVEVFHEMLGFIWNGQVMDALSLLDKVMWQGRELAQFVSDFIWYLRNLLLMQSSEYGAQMVDVSSEYKALMQTQANEVEEAALMRYIRDLSELGNRMRFASQKRVEVEIAVMKLCKPQTEHDYLDLADRIRQLETQIEDLVLRGPVQASVPVSAQAGRPEESAEQVDVDAELNRVLEPADAAKIKDVAAHWSNVKAKLGSPMDLYLDGAELNLGSDNASLMLTFPRQDDYGYMHISKPECLEELSAAVADIVGSVIRFQCQYRTSPKKTGDVHSINLAKINHLVEYED